MKNFLGPLIRLSIFAAAVVVLALTVRYYSGPEDTWLCQNGQWVAHGTPSTPKPDSTLCGSQSADLGSNSAKNIPLDKVLNRQGYLVKNSDNTWGFVYMSKNTPPYELGSAILQLEPQSICFVKKGMIAQPCARTSWQPGSEAAVDGLLLKPGLAKVLELRLLAPNSVK